MSEQSAAAWMKRMEKSLSEQTEHVCSLCKGSAVIEIDCPDCEARGRGERVEHVDLVNKCERCDSWRMSGDTATALAAKLAESDSGGGK